MPDSRAREPLPRDWGDAFGGLPLETPPEGAWQRVAIVQQSLDGGLLFGVLVGGGVVRRVARVLAK